MERRKKAIMIGSIGIGVLIIGVSVIIMMIMQTLNEGEISILEAGADSVPIIKSEDLDALGREYSILNESFEREINELTTGKANRHNKMDEELNHYGVNGKENEKPFQNEEYINGIRINYESNGENVEGGKSNFSDIIAVMSVMYEQKMDTIPIEELKETFTELFWLSHTYTFYSDKLYGCKKGCIAENNYKCTDVFNEYKNTKYLKYELFRVPYHEDYIEKGYEEDNFRVQVPIGRCTVHGEKGAGCILDENKVCYHGSGMEKFENCNKQVEIDEGETIIYSEIGEEVIPDNIDEMYIVIEPKEGQKVERRDSSCYYYRKVKYCKKREEVGEKIKNSKENLRNKQATELMHLESCDYSGDDECNTCKRNAEGVEEAMNELTELEAELEYHISMECEKDDNAREYWCDGYKLCMGHKNHYKCNGKHKVVLCKGHTNINVEVKIMYQEEMLNQIFK